MKPQTPISLFILNTTNNHSLQKAYTEQAKKLLDKYNLTTNMVQIAHALSATPLASDNAYHQDYIYAVKGKSRSGGGVDFYPDYIMSKKNTLLASKVCHFKN